MTATVTEYPKAGDTIEQRGLYRQTWGTLGSVERVEQDNLIFIQPLYGASGHLVIWPHNEYRIVR
jgi:hypothetical protein